MTATQTTSAENRAALRVWLGLAGTLLGLWGLCAFVQRLPAPASLDAPPERFSEARAMTVVRKLADEIGPHPIGSPAGAVAAEYLASELRKLPRLEVELQDAEGDNQMGMWTGIDFHYRVRNVLARLPGRRADAVLLNAHYDSPAEAPGGSDNGVGTASAFEAMRALASGAPLEWTIILSLNGGEEAGSVGAAGFLKHRWAKDVRVFIDLDGSCAGKATLAQASGHAKGLLSAYARAVRSPQGSVFANDLLGTGLLLFSGDFEPLSRAGLPGLDFAPLGDIWAVHTHLDRSTRLAPGTLQYEGNTILALAHELGGGGVSLETAPERTVYYDLLGQTTLVYSMRTARYLALGALVLLIGAVVLLLRRGEVTAGQLLRSLGWLLLSLFAGLFSALLAALLLVALLQRPHGFFATPILIVPTFIGAGLCGVIGVHALWRRRALSRGLGADASALAVFAAGLLVFGVILALCSFGSVGMGYLALWWVGPGAIVLIISMLIPRLRTALWLASLAIGAASFVHLYVLLIPAVVAMSGQAPLPPPADVKVAMLSWLLVVGPVALGGMAAAHRAGGLRIALYVCLCIAGLGIAATALRVPYTEARPKRIFATHAEKDGKAALLLMSMDLLPLDAALAGIPEAQAVAAGEDWPHSQLPPGWLPPYSHKLPAAPLDTPPPRLEILSRTEDAARGIRTLKLRLYASGLLTGIDIPKSALAGWSLGSPLPQPTAEQPMVSAIFDAPGEQGEELTLELRGAAPVEITLRQNHAPGNTKELLELRRRLPVWTAVNAGTVRIVRMKL